KSLRPGKYLIVAADNGAGPNAQVLALGDFTVLSSHTGATADFTTSVDVTSRTINRGQSTTYALTVQSTGGFNSAVDLFAINLPSGIASASWSQSSLTPPANSQASSTLTIVTNGSTSTGTFTITLRAARSGYTTKEIPVTLTINPTADF